jgi:hypothetical protein
MTTEMNKVIGKYDNQEPYTAFIPYGWPRYHVDWRLLMPVWFKVQSAGQQHPDFSAHDKAFYDGMRNGSIEKCHKAVYEAVLWLKEKEK